MSVPLDRFPYMIGDAVGQLFAPQTPFGFVQKMPFTAPGTPLGNAMIGMKALQPIFAPSGQRIGASTNKRLDQMGQGGTQPITAPRELPTNLPMGDMQRQEQLGGGAYGGSGLGTPIYEGRDEADNARSIMARGGPSNMGVGGKQGVGGGTPSSKIYQDIKAAVEPLRAYGVSEQQVEHYIRSNAQSHLGTMLTPRDAAAAAAADNQWAEEARRVGVLTGNRWADELIWKEHWAFNNGVSGRDPLLTGHPESQQRLRAQAENMVRDQSEDYFAPLLNNYRNISGVE